MSSSRSIRTMALWVTISVAALSLAGCGEAVDPNLEQINVLLDWKPQMEQAGFIVAREKGYYREVGLGVTFHEGQGATTTAALVGSGRYPLGISSGGATIIARSRGAHTVSLALINQRSPTVIFALESAGIRAPSDLVGKTIGLTQSGVKYDEYRALMNLLDINRSTIEEVDIRKAIVPSVLSGTVDAALAYTEDQPVLVELQGYDVVRIPIHDYGVNLLSTNIVSNEDYIAERPDVARKFIAASLKGWKYAIEHPDEAVATYLNRYPESNADFARENFRQFRPLLFSAETDSNGLGAQTLAGFVQTERLLHELLITEQRVDPLKAFTNEFLPRVMVSR
jgi:NitT/TauT family transport system substrate-binding protein